MLNAPFCYMGGKSKLRKEIIKRLPEHTCFVEVFGGAAWVLFGKEPSKVEVYNDIDGDLVNFFRIIKSCHKAFVQALEWSLISRRIFHDFLAQSPADLNEVQRAVRFYYIIKCSYGGKWRNPSFGYSKQGPASLHIENLYEVISEVHKRLRHVYIEEGTFQETIRRYDGPETIFFCDPPYFEAAKYKFHLATEEYAELEKTLAGINGKFLLTINDHEAMRSLWDKYRIEEIQVPYSISRNNAARGKYGELIVTNY
jgi:DNA adenine methylase